MDSTFILGKHKKPRRRSSKSQRSQPPPDDVPTLSSQVGSQPQHWLLDPRLSKRPPLSLPLPPWAYNRDQPADPRTASPPTSQFSRLSTEVPTTACTSSAPAEPFGVVSVPANLDTYRTSSSATPASTSSAISRRPRIRSIFDTSSDESDSIPSTP